MGIAYYSIYIYLKSANVSRWEPKQNQQWFCLLLIFIFMKICIPRTFSICTIKHYEHLSSWFSILIRITESWILQSCAFSIHDLFECMYCCCKIDVLKIGLFSWQITLPLKTSWKVHKYFHIGLRRRKRTGIWLRDKSDRFCFFMERIMSKKGKLLRKVTWPGLRDEQPKWIFMLVRGG